MLLQWISGLSDMALYAAERFRRFTFTSHLHDIAWHLHHIYITFTLPLRCIIFTLHLQFYITFILHYSCHILTNFQHHTFDVITDVVLQIFSYRSLIYNTKQEVTSDFLWWRFIDFGEYFDNVFYWCSLCWGGWRSRRNSVRTLVPILQPKHTWTDFCQSKDVSSTVFLIFI